MIVLAGGYVVVHFFQDDPGWWFLDSHIDYHLNNGMAIEVSENSYRASSPSEPLLADTKNVCFTIQRLDKELPLAMSYKILPEPSLEVIPPLHSSNSYFRLLRYTRASTGTCLLPQPELTSTITKMTCIMRKSTKLNVIN